MTNHYTDVCEETIKSLRQQLEQAHADIAGLHDQLEEPQIAQDDYRLNKQEIDQLRQQLADSQQALRNVYEVRSLCYEILVPVTVMERYLVKLIEQMRDVAKEGMK